MDEMVSEKDFKKHDKMNNNKNPYENTGEKNEKKKKEEAKLEMEMEKDIDEKEGLLDDDDRTPSVVEELSSFIDDQYEQMDRTDNYVNSWAELCVLPSSYVAKELLILWLLFKVMFWIVGNPQTISMQILLKYRKYVGWIKRRGTYVVLWKCKYFCQV